MLSEKAELNDGQDSLQAFSSSIAGMLSSRAVLEGMFPRPISLIILKILQESESVTPTPRQQLLSSSRSCRKAWVE